MINNRQQSGRRRGRGGQRTQGGGNPGRPDTGNRIDSRARGNASQLYEKYKTLARDAQMQGDRVNTEYYLQFADHYFRVLSETRSRYEEQNPQAQGQRRPSNDPFDDGFDGDEEYGDEGEPVRADQYQPRQSEPHRDDRRPDEGEQRNDGQHRGDSRRYESRNDRNDSSDRNDDRGQSRNDGRDSNRSYNGSNGQNGTGTNGQARGRTRPAFTPQAAPVADAAGAASLAAAHAPDVAMTSEARAADGEAAAPRRRGRPRKVDAAAPAGDDQPAAFDATLLPPSLSAPAAAGGDDAKPRRRRGRPPASETVPAS